MRHRVYGKKLGRNKNERTALFKSLVQSLFLHGTITTSETKAKAIKGQIDKIINLAKDKNSQRLLKSFFNNKLLEERLIKEIAPKMQNRTSGYTSLMKIAVRTGDNTRVVKMSLIGAEQLKPLEKKTEPSKKVEVKKLVSEKKVAPRKTATSKTEPARRRRAAKLSKTK